jgi:hypothetical protein
VHTCQRSTTTGGEPFRPVPGPRWAGELLEDEMNTRLTRGVRSGTTGSTPGVFTLRHNSRLQNTGVDLRHGAADILVLSHDLHIRVLNSDGELLRELHLDPSKDYESQPPTRAMSGDARARCPRHHSGGGGGI